MKKMSFEERRLSLRILGFLFLISLINYYANWHFLGGFDAVAVISFVPLIMLHYFIIGPSIEEFEKHRRLEGPQSVRRLRSLFAKSSIIWNVVRAILVFPVLLALTNHFSSKLGWFGSYTAEAIAVTVFLSALAHGYLRPGSLEDDDGSN